MQVIASLLRCRRRRPPLLDLRWLMMCLPILLAACGSDDAPPPTCPKVVMVDDAAKVIRFRGEGRDLTDVIFEARIAAGGLACEYDDNVLEVDLLVEVEAARGPAETNRQVDMSYFVAIADRSRNIVAREAFENTLPFPGNKTRVTLKEEIEPRIPLKPGESGNDYFIFVGLELSPAELQYNRANR